MKSIRARMVFAVVAMAAVLGILAFLVSGQLSTLSSDLSDLHDVQDVKSHVLAPQKDMNQFIGYIDNTLLWLDLGNAEEAQAAYEGTVDAEQDISGEFAYLEAHATGEVLPMVQQAHKDWEIATEFMKIQVEATGAEKGFKLVRPTTEPTKTVDAHTTEAASEALAKFGSMDVAALTAVTENDEAYPVELADVGIDGTTEKVDEILATYQARGDESLDKTRQLIMLGLLAALAGVVGIGVFATMSIMGPLGKLKTGAKKIADGDLDFEFGNVSGDEIGVVTKTVEEMAHSLKSRIRNLEEVAGVVVLTSDEISTEAKSGADADLGMIGEKADMMKGLISEMLTNPDKA